MIIIITEWNCMFHFAFVFRINVIRITFKRYGLISINLCCLLARPSNKIIYIAKIFLPGKSTHKTHSMLHFSIDDFTSPDLLFINATFILQKTYARYTEIYRINQFNPLSFWFPFDTNTRTNIIIMFAVV